MGLKEIPDFMKDGTVDKKNSKGNLICISIGKKVQYISVIEAAMIANSIVTQLSLIGEGIVSQKCPSDDKTNISRKTGFGT